MSIHPELGSIADDFLSPQTRVAVFSNPSRLGHRFLLLPRYGEIDNHRRHHEARDVNASRAPQHRQRFPIPHTRVADSSRKRYHEWKVGEISFIFHVSFRLNRQIESLNGH